jgi:hypothetical protein
MTALPLILSTHVDREPALDGFDLAFVRLGGFLDAEAPTIEALGRALSLPHVLQSICALHLLHRGEGVSDRKVIETAIRHLTDLRDELLSIPSDAAVVNPQAFRRVLSHRDVDAAIRFMGARVDDQISALKYAIDRK